MVNPDEKPARGLGRNGRRLGDQHDYALSFEFTADAPLSRASR
jgi:hypothetical protein